LRQESEIHFYRIAQECLNNAVKHAHAKVITVLIQRQATHVSLVISDDGAGFNPERPSSNGTPGGFGLTGISERAQLLGGTASIRSAPGQGTTVTLEIPIENGPEAGANAWQMKSAL
jgi:signal transduction histidine kinase